jgi:glycosyltransferase involved in cell wall biosynthesis
VAGRHVRVAVDARPAVFPRKTGIGFYIWHLLRELPRVDPSTQYVAWYLDVKGALTFRSRGALSAAAGRQGRGDGLALIERQVPIPARLFEQLSERFDLPRAEWFARFDVLFAPNFVPPPTRAPRLVLTVHDLAFRLFPETAPHSTRRWLTRLDQALQRAAAVIAVSAATKDDLTRLYGVPSGRITVVPHGVDRTVFRPSSEARVAEVRARFGIEGPYLLSLGGIEPRKNLARLVEAFGLLSRRTGLPEVLVIAGGGVEWNPEGPGGLEAALRTAAPGIRERIRLTGYVEEADKVALMGGATALVYPSLYEGFGLPALEAMACGTPVLTSNVSALPEVVGTAGLLVDPGDAEAIAEGMRRLCEDESLRARLREEGLARSAGFSWTETARRTAAVLHEAGSHG